MFGMGGQCRASSFGGVRDVPNASMASGMVLKAGVRVPFGCWWDAIVVCSYFSFAGPGLRSSPVYKVSRSGLRYSTLSAPNVSYPNEVQRRTRKMSNAAERFRVEMSRW